LSLEEESEALPLPFIFAMGIPSPFLGEARRASPELSMLEAVGELAGFDIDELQPLPISSFDLKHQGAEVPTPATGTPWTDEEHESAASSEECSSDSGISTGMIYVPVPAYPGGPSPYGSIIMKNTFLDRRCTYVEEEVVQRPRAESDWTGLLRLEAEAAETLSRTNSTTLPAEDADEVEVDFEVEALQSSSLPLATSTEAANGDMVPMWCAIQHDGMCGTVIMPCEDCAAAEAACQMGAQMVQLWCWTRQDGQKTIAVPCTNWAPEQEEVSAAEALCAPAPPSAGSFCPIWQPAFGWNPSVLPTTLILGNLPASLEQETLLEVLDREEFSGFYDFVFLLPGTENGSFQEAIVNLTRHAYASSLAALLHGRTTWGEGNGTDACEVRWSVPLQGQNNLVEHYRNHAANGVGEEASLGPQLFKKGWPEVMPRPVWEIC